MQEGDPVRSPAEDGQHRVGDRFDAQSSSSYVSAPVRVRTASREPCRATWSAKRAGMERARSPRGNGVNRAAGRMRGSIRPGAHRGAIARRRPERSGGPRTHQEVEVAALGRLEDVLDEQPP